MTIKHHGAVDGTTGSAHEWIVDDNNSILIDCGLFQGSDHSPSGQASADNLAIDFDISNIKALVLTHVHIDHVGRLPWLLAAGFDGPIYCSEPSAKLLPIVLEDAFRLSFSRQPRQIAQYLTLVEQRLQPIPYNQWREVPQGGARIRLQRAGHILGSAYIECEAIADGQGAGAAERIVFSGDLGAPHAPILPAPDSPNGCDTLIIESTYGNRIHENREQRRQRLEQVVEQALQNKGTVLIPAFSIGRTQELLYELEDILFRRQAEQIRPGLRWGDLPVILDSPLASRFTRVYRQLQPYWDQEALDKLKAQRKPLGFQQLITVDEHDAHQRMVAHLAKSRRPAIVISGSGMCTGGRIINYLKAMLGDPRHHVLFVGYQVKGSAGRVIQQYGPRGGYVDLDDQRFNIKAGVTTIGGYSAHADQQNLLDFVANMQHWPGKIRIVHGDCGAKQALAEKLRALYRQQAMAGLDIEVPTR